MDASNLSIREINSLFTKKELKPSELYSKVFENAANSEAALPMVFSTTLLLILIVITLNLTAILLRNRLKKKYKGMI